MYQHSSSTTDSTALDLLALDDSTTIWNPHDTWSADQPNANLCLDSGMPRSVRQDLAHSDLALAHAAGFGPTVGDSFIW